ncbi:hypothetical protein AF332_20060 [Sporosarcina globispora]|uniref:Uncharacterized protein n=1 Tax=Sporosarcina globispora TaxID=1459 RepID=A0A0M0GHF0_SPOGL|nr:hypothetical protein [Sporosarcina globispora]KON88866.1 hypothetical protein AF332_20060 [Sporosarcina globispora]
MNEIKLQLNKKMLKMLEEITEQYNKEIGIVSSKEEALEHLIYAHYICEVKGGRKPNDTNNMTISVTITK